MESDLFITMLKMNKLKKNLPYLFLCLILLVHLSILAKLIFFPYPELFIYPYLTNQGLLPYSQILDQHFPGLMFLPINFDNLGMTNEVIARWWLIAIVIITHLFLFFISKNILKNGFKALLVNLLYLIWQPFFEGWVLWIDNFLPLFLLPAFYMLLKRKFFLVGLLLGFGVVFKQTIIPLALFVFAYIWWSDRNFKNAGRYFLGLSLPIGGMLIYLLSIGVMADFWYWTIIFNLTVYASSGTQIPTSFGFISRVFVVYTASLSGLYHTDRRLKIILSLFLIGSLVGAFDRANFVHFQPSLPFVVIGTALGFYSLGKKKMIFILIGLYLVITIWWQNIFYQGHVSSKVFFFNGETYAISNKIRQYTKEGDKIFVFGAAPHLYQMSQTLPAGDIFVFQFPWFLKIAEQRILEGIKKDHPEIIVYDKTTNIEGYKLIDFAKSIDEYINQNYKNLDSVGNVEILRKI